MKCPLCGIKFDEQYAQKACKGCPFHKSCNLIKCPNCGYEFPGESKIVKLIEKWRQKFNETK